MPPRDLFAEVHAKQAGGQEPVDLFVASGIVRDHSTDAFENLGGFGALQGIEARPVVDPNAGHADQGNQRIAQHNFDISTQHTIRDVERGTAAYDAAHAGDAVKQLDDETRYMKLGRGGAIQQIKDEDAAYAASHPNPDTLDERIRKSLIQNWANIKETAAGMERQGAENAADFAGRVVPGLAPLAQVAKPFVDRATAPIVKASSDVYVAAQKDIAANGYKFGSKSDYYGQQIIDSVVQMVPTLATAYLTKGDSLEAQAAAEGAAESANPIVRGLAKFRDSIRENLPSLSVLGEQQGAQEYGSERAAGRTVAQSNIGALVVGLAEALPEGMELNVLMKPGGKILPRLLKSAGIDGAGEMLTQIVEEGYQAKVLTPDMTWGQAWQQMIDSGAAGRVLDAGIVGTAMGFGMGGGAHAIHAARGGEAGATVRSIRDAEFTTSAGDEATNLLDPNRDILPVPRQPVTPGLVEQAAAQPAITPEDQASPLPTDLIEQGRRRIATVEAQGKANQILGQNQAPKVGTEVSLGGKRATIADAFTDDGGEAGVTLRFASGQTQKVYLSDLADAGMTLEPAPAPRDVLGEIASTEREAPSAPLASRADPDAAIRFVMNTQEGGGKRTVDSGGVTRFGISQNAHPEVNVDQLTEKQAVDIYRKDYWDKLGLDNADPRFAVAALDTAINHGMGKGPELVAEAHGDTDKLLALRQQEYDRLVRENPAKYGQYANGWRNRLEKLAGEIGTAPAPVTTDELTGVAPTAPAADEINFLKDPLLPDSGAEHSFLHETPAAQPETALATPAPAEPAKLEGGDPFAAGEVQKEPVPPLVPSAAVEGKQLVLRDITPEQRTAIDAALPGKARLVPRSDGAFVAPVKHEDAVRAVLDEALGRQAPASTAADTAAATSYTTAKGSSYEVHPDGTTTRNKAFRPEHGEAEQGPQPRSEQTFYVTPEHVQALGEIHAQGGHPTAVIVDQGHAALRYSSGPDAGKIERRTVVPISDTPSVGAIPVETWKGGTRVHFGNPITEVRSEPPAAEAAPSVQSGEGMSETAPVPHQESSAAPVAAVTTEPAPATNSRPTASWVIRNKETGEVIAETYDPKKVEALNTAKYEAVPIMDHLQSINDPASKAGAWARRDGGNPVSPASEALAPPPFNPEPHIDNLRAYIAKSKGSLNNIDAIAKHLGLPAEQAHAVMGAVASRPNAGFRMSPGKAAIVRKVEAGGGRTRTVTVRNAVPPRYIRDAKRTAPMSTMAFVRSLGGINDPRHDLRNVGGLRNHPGVLTNAGRPVDEIGRALWEDGRFPNKDPSDPDQRPTVDETIQFLADQSQGKRSTVPEQRAPSEEDARAQAADELKAALKESGGLLPSAISNTDREAIIDDMLASGGDAASAAYAHFERQFVDALAAGSRETGSADYDIPFDLGAPDEASTERDRQGSGAQAGEAGSRPESQPGDQGAGQETGADRGQDGGAAGQLDAFGSRAGDQRTALERQAEGRKQSDKAQKAPGSDGGLFDTADQTGELFSRDGKHRVTTPDFTNETEHQASADAVLAELQKRGVDGKVALRIVELIYGDPRIAGRYHRGVIDVALQAAQSPTFTANHEVVHFVKETGRINKSEWTAMTRAALADPALMASVERRYPNLSRDGQIEEAIADLMAGHVDGTRPQKGLARTALDRVVEFLRALGHALAGNGFATSHGTLARFESGEIGARAGNGRVANPSPREMVAYHGTPHDFDSFDTSKIGTGEGNQSFGHGLYFAGRKEVAEHYRDTLTREFNAKQDVIRQWVKDAGGDWSKAHQAYLDYWKDAPAYIDPEIEAALRRGRPGRTFTVDIPEENEYLLWDKPLSEQPEKVRAALESLGVVKKPAIYPLANGKFAVGGNPAHFDSQAEAEQYLAENAAAFEPTGEKLYRDLGKMLTGRDPNKVSLARNGGDREASRALHEEGIAGIKYLDGGSRADGTGSHNYVVFDDSRVKVLEKYSIAERTAADIENTGSTTPPLTTMIENEGGGEGKGTGSDTFDKWRTALQDRMLPLLRTQQRVEAVLGRELDEDENPYLAEELMTGKVGARLEQLSEDLVNPLFAAMKEEGVSVGELESYLYARHAPERNAQIAKINPEFSEGEGSGMTDIEAKAILARVDKAGRTEALQRTAEKVDAILKFAVDTRVESGLLSEEEAKAWRDTYQNYVPLRGLAEDEDTLNPERPRRGSGINVRGKESQRAFGRRSKAEDILAHTIMQAEESIVRAQTNEVGQRFLEVAKAAPDNSFWTIDKVRRVPVENKTTGQISYRVESRIAAEDAPYTISVKVDGEEHRITLNRDNPSAVKLADSMRNLTGSELNAFAAFFGRFTRAFSALNTRYVPSFIVTNAIRDLSTAAVNLQQYDVPGLFAGTFRDYRKAMFAPKTGDGEWAKWRREFELAGGKIYFNDIGDIHKIQKRIERQINAARSPGSASAALKGFFNGVEMMNDHVENAIRLAAYKNARVGGLSKDKAASIARNVTVNFTRKGKYGPAINSLYAFFNVGTQGVATLSIGAMRSKKVRATLLGVVVAGFIMDALNAAISDDDDDGVSFWSKVPESDKERNIILMIPGQKGKMLKLPVSLELNAFFNMGRVVSELTSGRRSVSSSIGEIAWGFADGFNPFSGGGSKVNYILPTIIDPMAELAVNRNFAGKPIQPNQSPYDPPVTPSSNFFPAVNPLAKDLTDALNRATGGDDVQPGYASISPNVAQYLFGYYTGGAGRFVGDIAGIAAKAYHGEAPKLSDVPIVDRVVGDKPAWYDKSVAYSRLDDIDQRMGYAKAYQKAGDAEGFQRFVGENGAELRYLQPLATWTRKEMSEIRKARGAITVAHDRGRLDDATFKADKDRLDAVEQTVVFAFNKRYLEIAAKPVGLKP